MATEPTNKLVRIAELNTTLPIAGGPNKIEPESRILSTGYDDDNAVFAQDLNYTFDNLAQWISYSQERLNEVDQTITDLEKKHDQDIATLEAQIIKERVSVGEIIEITGDSTNPATLKGYGTWVSFGQGQVLVGVGSHTDDRGENKSWTDGQSQGENRHVQTVAELAQHNHPDNLSASMSNSGDHEHPLPLGNNRDTASPLNKPSYSNDNNNAQNYTIATSGGHVHPITVSGGVQNAGSSTPMNNIQPSLAVYRWKRTA